MNQTLLADIRTLTPELESIRHDIHRHPETCYEESRTAALVAAKLREWGIPVAEGIAVTGVVGSLTGARPGQRAIALRADMDALDITEQTGVPYASTIPGKMHACGHDGHTAMLLGAARYLSEHRDFAGTVHFIFQPAEEGGAGGRRMVEEGLFDRFPADAVYGMHNGPGMPLGQVGSRVGPMLSAADAWAVTFRGTGGHGGAAPHLATDPTIPQAHFVLGLQTIIGRNVAAIDTAVLSIGSIIGGSPAANSVIPSEVRLRGTARCYRPEVRDLLQRRIGELAQAMAAAHGCSAEVVYTRHYPPLINHAEQVGVALDAARATFGAEMVNPDLPPITAGEDFAFMLEARPGAFVMIGNGAAADGSFHNVHTPLYDFNDALLPLGAAYWVGLVREELGGG
jgi:hippurate hydrolase